MPVAFLFLVPLRRTPWGVSTHSEWIVYVGDFNYLHCFIHWCATVNRTESYRQSGTQTISEFGCHRILVYCVRKSNTNRISTSTCTRTHKRMVHKSQWFQSMHHDKFIRMATSRWKKNVNIRTFYLFNASLQQVRWYAWMYRMQRGISLEKCHASLL